MVPIETLREDVLEKVIQAVRRRPSCSTRRRSTTSTRPAASWSAARRATAALTGRKIIVDTYGGVGSHGGGAFSGKDPTKVDRSASYMARHVAKNLVAAGLAEKIELQIAYAIGVADPVSIMVDTMGTGTVDEGEMVKAIREIFPLTPKGIIEYLDLRRPIFRKTAAYGHFGRQEPEFTWEKTNKAAELKAWFKR